MEIDFVEEQVFKKKYRSFKNVNVRGYSWTVYTDHLGSDENVDAFWKGLDDLNPSYRVYGWELCPTTQREHLQGYFYFPNKKSAMVILKALSFCKIHLEIAKKSAAHNRLYCLGLTKDKKPNDIFVEEGICPQQGERGDLNNVYNELLDGTPLRKVYLMQPELTCKYFRGFKLIADTVAQKKYQAPEVVETNNAAEALQYLQEAYNANQSEIFVQLQSDSFGNFNQYNGHKYGIILNNNTDTKIQKETLEGGFAISARNGTLYAFKCVVFCKEPFLMKK